MNPEDVFTPDRYPENNFIPVKSTNWRKQSSGRSEQLHRSI